MNKPFDNFKKYYISIWVQFFDENVLYFKSPFEKAVKTNTKFQQQTELKGKQLVRVNHACNRHKYRKDNLNFKTSAKVIRYISITLAP